MHKFQLSFERPLVDLQKKIEELKNTQSGKTSEIASEIKKLENRIEKLRVHIYSNLSPWQKVQVARHPERPVSSDYIALLFGNFIEIHGDRAFKDDHSIIGGFATIDGHKVVLIGEEKGKNTKEKMRRNFGMPHPEGYRKVLRIAKMAEKFRLPLICLIDTPGAYPGVGAEERGQGIAIAENLMEFSRLKTPVIGVNIGEGASGGALAIGVCDWLIMLENSYYSVISPEGCATILFGDSIKADEAAVSLKLTADDLSVMGFVDEIVPEPLGGAHIDKEEVAFLLDKAIVKALNGLIGKSPEKLVEKRYRKLRSIGSYTEAKAKSK